MVVLVVVVVGLDNSDPLLLQMARGQTETKLPTEAVEFPEELWLVTPSLPPPRPLISKWLLHWFAIEFNIANMVCIDMCKHCLKVARDLIKILFRELVDPRINLIKLCFPFKFSGLKLDCS